MAYSIEYFHPRVKQAIEQWPGSILSDYARLVELLVEFGPDLRIPHTRALGDGLFELRPHGKEGIGRALYCYLVDQKIVILHALIKKTRMTPTQGLAIARSRMKAVKHGWT